MSNRSFEKYYSTFRAKLTNQLSEFAQILLVHKLLGGSHGGGGGKVVFLLIVCIGAIQLNRLVKNHCSHDVGFEVNEMVSLPQITGSINEYKMLMKRVTKHLLSVRMRIFNGQTTYM